MYILFWIFIFQFHLLKFNFYINFGPHFYNCYLFFPYDFFIEFFYLSNLILIFFIVTYFIWNNLWNVNYFFLLLLILFEIIYEMLIIIILISSSFMFFFYFLDLISIILIIIYFIWDNLWNYIFFQFHSHSTFYFVRFIPYYFNKLEKNKTLISYFSNYFLWHNQTLESVFQFIFYYITKHQKIIYFSGIHFKKKITFQQINRP